VIELIIDDIHAASREFIDNLDRSSMKGLVCNIDALYLCDVSYRITRELKTIPIADRSDADNAIYSDSYIALTVALTYSIMTDHDVRSELLFWWTVSGDDALSEFAWSSPESDLYITDIHQRYHYSHPAEMRPYFRLGIWDVGFIEQCISDDIDPALAVSMRESLAVR